MSDDRKLIVDSLGRNSLLYSHSFVVICMLALLVFSILEMLAKRNGIVMTGESILKQFQTMTVVYNTTFRDGSCWKQVAPSGFGSARS